MTELEADAQRVLDGDADTVFTTVPVGVGRVVDVGVVESERLVDELAVDEPLADEERDAVEDAVADAEGDALRVDDAVELRVLTVVFVARGLRDDDGVVVDVAEMLGELVVDELAVVLELGDSGADADVDAVADVEGVDVDVGDDVRLTEVDAVDVFDTDDVDDMELDAVDVPDPDADRDGVCVDVDECEKEVNPDGVMDVECVTVADADPEIDTVALFESVWLSESVSEKEPDTEPDIETDGVSDVNDDCDGETVGLVVVDADVVDEPEIDGDAVLDSECDELDDTVIEPVCESDPDGDDVSVKRALVAVGASFVGVGTLVRVELAEMDCDPDPDSELNGDSDLVSEIKPDGELDVEGERVPLGLCDDDDDTDAEPDMRGDTDVDKLCDGDQDKEPDAVMLRVELPEEDARGDAVDDADRHAVAVMLWLAVFDTDKLPLGDTRGDIVTVEDADAVALPAVEAVRCAVAVVLGVTSALGVGWPAAGASSAASSSTHNARRGDIRTLALAGGGGREECDRPRIAAALGLINIMPVVREERGWRGRSLR